MRNEQSKLQRREERDKERAGYEPCQCHHLVLLVQCFSTSCPFLPRFVPICGFVHHERTYLDLTTDARDEVVIGIFWVRLHNKLPLALVALERERVNLGRKVRADVVLLRVEARTLPDDVVAVSADTFDRKLEADNTIELRLVCPFGTSMLAHTFLLIIAGLYVGGGNVVPITLGGSSGGHGRRRGGGGEVELRRKSSVRKNERENEGSGMG